MSQDIVISILSYVLAISYVVSIVFYGIAFFSKDTEKTETYSKKSKLLIRGVIILHIIYFIIRSIDYKHAPITSIFELLTLLAFSLTITYIYIELKTKVYQTGFFILLIAGIFQIISTLFIQELKEINPVLRSWLLGVHVSTALIGYSAIMISGIYGFLYLMMYKSIKSNNPSNFYRKLPSLQLLEKLAAYAIKFGFVFLTITILIGAIWLPSAIDNFSYADPKLIVTFMIWVVYALGFTSIKIYRTQSKTTMTLAFLGFVFAFVSMLILNFLFTSFHRFY